MTAVLVTGGAGYIGAHVCKALARAGWQPVAYDDLSNGHAEAVRWGPLIEADLLDGDALAGAFRAFRPAAVIHLAGLIEVGRSMREPELFHRVNVEGSRRLLDAMAGLGAEAGVGRLVFSSSAAVYGEPEETPIPEDHPLRPASVYGETKRLVEAMLAERGLAHVALRYFNAAGADPDGEIGERHEPETHALPLAIMAALEGSEFQVFGTDYPTADGTAVRDYVHVADLAEAHVAALRHLEAGGAGGAFNLGTGQGVSVRELVAAVEARVGRPLKTREAPRREGDPAVLVAAPGDAARVLDWRPQVGEFDAIVESAVRWHRHLMAAAD